MSEKIFQQVPAPVPRHQEYNPELFVLIPGQNQPLLVLKLKYVQTAFSFKA